MRHVEYGKRGSSSSNGSKVVYATIDSQPLVMRGCDLAEVHMLKPHKNNRSVAGSTGTHAHAAGGGGAGAGKADKAITCTSTFSVASAQRDNYFAVGTCGRRVVLCVYYVYMG